MKDVSEITKEDAGCNEYQADLYLAENKDGEEYFFLSGIHWITKYEEEKKHRIAHHSIPIQTKFTKVPSAVNELSYEEMLNALEEQREYWQSEYNKRWADHINNAQDYDVSKDERTVNTKSGLRYKQRVNACEHLIEKLKEYREQE